MTHRTIEVMVTDEDWSKAMAVYEDMLQQEGSEADITHWLGDLLSVTLRLNYKTLAERPSEEDDIPW